MKNVYVKSLSDIDSIVIHNMEDMRVKGDCSGNPEMIYVDEWHNSLTIYHFPLCNNFQILACNEFLRKICPGTDCIISFHSYNQYVELVSNIRRELLTEKTAKIIENMTMGFMNEAVNAMTDYIEYFRDSKNADEKMLYIDLFAIGYIEGKRAERRRKTR